MNKLQEFLMLGLREKVVPLKKRKRKKESQLLLQKMSSLYASLCDMFSGIILITEQLSQTPPYIFSMTLLSMCMHAIGAAHG